MNHKIENMQYGLHSTLWVLGKDVHTAGVTPPKCSVTPPGATEDTQRHTTTPNE